MSAITRAVPRAMGAGLAAIALALAVTACVPEPAPGSSSAPDPSASESLSPSATATPEPTATDSAFALPATCEELYSPEMLATLQAQNPPLNDPGVTMYSTQIVEGLEVLNSGAPTMRCSWGQPSEFGLATNLTVVTAEQSDSVEAALAVAGFACSDVSEGTLCRFEQELLTQDDTIVHRGEAHFFRGDGWLTTAWIDFAPEGYTEDIIATVWD